MNKWITALFLGAAVIGVAVAQQVSMPPPAGTTAVLCAYNTVEPTITTGNVGFLQCDSTGNLITSGSFTGTVTQGNAGTNAQAWWVRIGDATNGPAAVKPASTAALATDPALVTRNFDLGAQADAVCATSTGTCSLVALMKYNNSTNPILGAGSAIIGKVGIDQTTPGTTNAVASTPVASEIHVGEVGGNIIVITNAMTTSNNAIAAGEVVGGIQTLTGAARVSGAVGAAGTGGLIQSVVVSFKDVVVATSLDVWFFNAALAGATCADNTNFTLANADRPKVIGIAHLTDINGTTTVGTAPTFAQANTLAMPFSLASATSILACVVNRGATFTPADTTGATIQVTVLRN